MVDYKKFFKTVYDVCDNSLNSLGDYADKASKAYDELLKKLSRDGFSKNDIGKLCTEKELSRIFCEVDEMAEAGYNIDKQSVALFKFYKLVCNKVSGKQVDLTDLSTTEINKLSGYSKALSQVGGVTLLINTFGVLAKSVQLIKEGDEDGAGVELRKYGYGLLGGVAGSVFAEFFISSLIVTNPIAAVGILTLCVLAGTSIGEGLGKLFEEIFFDYDDAGAYTYPVDPLIFDLNGNGIDTVSVENGVNFDFDKNGFAEKIGWVGSNDGLLVRDLDGNGKIDSGSELMGDLTALADGSNAPNGFDALRAFDLNEDGEIDSSDSIYSELQIWQDKNQNGIVDFGELYTLEQVGIESINLNYENISETDDNGNSHTQRSYFTRSDGTRANVEDVWFAKDAADTVIDEETIEYAQLSETNEISKLPDIVGHGNQYTLHQAMLRDTTGRLQHIVESYVAEGDISVRKSMLPDIIYLWTDVYDMDPASRGSNISDSRKLAALEVITGRNFDSAYGSNPVQQAGIYLEQAFDKLVEAYYGQLEMQTTYVADYAELFVNFDVDDEGNIIYDISSLSQKYMAKYEDDPNEGRIRIFELVNNLRMTGIDSAIGKDKIYEAFPVAGSDLYHAAEFYGDNKIVGTNGDDIIIGEGGNDTLSGGSGKDTYIFNLGDGEDVIDNWDQSNWRDDRIVFGEGVEAEDVELYRNGYDLIFRNKTNEDMITVRNAFYDGYGRYYFGGVEFADGTKWDNAYLQEHTRHYTGTDDDDVMNGQDWGYNYNQSETFDGGDGNDTINGNDGNDIIIGGNGSDTIFGGNGDDVITGGTGNDTLSGGSGKDTYIFNLGDGEDVVDNWDQSNWIDDRIVFGEGVKVEDVELYRNGYDLVIRNKTRKPGGQVSGKPGTNQGDRSLVNHGDRPQGRVVFTYVFFELQYMLRKLNYVLC